MADMDFNISPDTQAVLLLCGALGRQDRSLAPLTVGQYGVFMTALLSLGKRPSDLIGANGPEESLVKEACAVPNGNCRVVPADSAQIIALLRRGMSLATAVDKWAGCGIHVIGKADEAYPKRLKEHLGGRAPSLIYYAGNQELFAGGGMAFVGSRDIDQEAVEAVRTVVRGCVDLGMNVVSGGARGADQAAMQEAFSLGGKVVGAIPCDLMKACLEPANRDALANGNTLLFSAFDPEVRPFSYGQVAMDRNKYIYGMADACFVAQSGIGTKSGTWAGAAEELKRKNAPPIPVYVFLGNPPSPGCLDLQKMGAKAWDMEKSVAENLLPGADAKHPKTLQQDDLFGSYSAAEPVAPYGADKENRVDAPVTQAEATLGEKQTPYELFLECVKELLTAPRKETEVKKRLGSELDLVAAQVKRWLEKAEAAGVVVRKEYPKGKKKCVMLELVR